MNFEYMNCVNNNEFIVFQNYILIYFLIRLCLIVPQVRELFYPFDFFKYFVFIDYAATILWRYQPLQFILLETALRTRKEESMATPFILEKERWTILKNLPWRKLKNLMWVQTIFPFNEKVLLNWVESHKIFLN